MSDLQLEHRPPLVFGRLNGFERLNRGIVSAFHREQGGPFSRQSHLELGRYENSYIERGAIPEIEPLCAAAKRAATEITAQADLRLGFWFNEMAPGQRTARHNHEQDDELLSCVYYLETAPECGDLLVHHPGGTIRVTPREGLFVFFSPRLAHEVEENRSDRIRLSLAFNFGPPNG